MYANHKGIKLMTLKEQELLVKGLIEESVTDMLCMDGAVEAFKQFDPELLSKYFASELKKVLN